MSVLHFGTMSTPGIERRLEPIQSVEPLPQPLDDPTQYPALRLRPAPIGPRELLRFDHPDHGVQSAVEPVQFRDPRHVPGLVLVGRPSLPRTGRPSTASPAAASSRRMRATRPRLTPRSWAIERSEQAGSARIASAASCRLRMITLPGRSARWLGGFFTATFPR